MGWECCLYIGKFNEYYRKDVPDIVALLYFGAKLSVY
jgi:hypothetical protein